MSSVTLSPDVVSARRLRLLARRRYRAARSALDRITRTSCRTLPSRDNADGRDRFHALLGPAKLLSSEDYGDSMNLRQICASLSPNAWLLSLLGAIPSAPGSA